MSIDEDEPVEIPDTPATRKAAVVLAAAPMDSTSEQLDALIRRTATVASPVRKAMVGQEIRRRANRQEDHAQAEQKPVELKTEEVEYQDEIPAKLALHSGSILRENGPLLVTVVVIVAGIAAWFYHSHEVKRHAAEAVVAAAAAREQQARSIVVSARNSWNADDNWEDTFSSKGTDVTPYTIELENALMKGRPIVAFGLVDDVRKSGEQDNSIVLIQDIGRTMKGDLRFSLLSAPAITKAILNDEDRRSETFVIAATITSVEKVSMPPDEKDNNQDYFLAHGILHEAQPIGPFADPPHK